MLVYSFALRRWHHLQWITYILKHISQKDANHFTIIILADFDHTKTSHLEPCLFCRSHIIVQI